MLQYNILRYPASTVDAGRYWHCDSRSFEADHGEVAMHPAKPSKLTANQGAENTDFVGYYPDENTVIEPVIEPQKASHFEF